MYRHQRLARVRIMCARLPVMHSIAASAIRAALRTSPTHSLRRRPRSRRRRPRDATRFLALRDPLDAVERQHLRREAVPRDHGEQVRRHADELLQLVSDVLQRERRAQVLLDAGIYAATSAADVRGEGRGEQTEIEELADGRWESEHGAAVAVVQRQQHRGAFRGAAVVQPRELVVAPAHPPVC